MEEGHPVFTPFKSLASGTSSHETNAVLREPVWDKLALPSQQEGSEKRKIHQQFFYIKFELLLGDTTWALKSVWKEKWSQMWGRTRWRLSQLFGACLALGSWEGLLSMNTVCTLPAGEWEWMMWRFFLSHFHFSILFYFRSFQKAGWIEE